MQYIIKTVDGSPSGNPISVANAIESGILNIDASVKHINSNLLADSGYCLYVKTTPPLPKNLLEEYQEVDPVFVEEDLTYIQTFELVDRVFSSDEERQKTLDYVLESKKKEIREKRNELLNRCDYTQITDAPCDKAAWSVYRQQLRDITNQTSFASGEVEWPEPPFALEKGV